ncbi:MAG TPA: amino acid adenylation domain-containing protein, partial [Herpetosiphonaceae bacterium]
TLVLRTDLSGQPTVRALLARVREVCLNAYAQQDVPFERVVEAVQPQRALSHTPLFQVMFVLQNTPRADLQLPGVTVTGAEGSNRQAKFDLTLTLTESADELRGSLEYATDLFDAERIERLAAHFTTLLAACVAQPDRPMTSLPLLTTAEQQLLVAWNATREPYPQDRCVHDLVTAQVERTPDAVAVRCGVEALTYAALHAQATQLAGYLRAHGVGPEMRVGLCVERSVELVVAVLAVWHAGAAYVPLDPSYPQERLAFMIADADLALVLTQRALLAVLPPVDAPLVVLDRDAEAIAATPSLPSVARDPAQLAYVLYTSGSTGRPKGVQVAQGAVVNFLHTMQTAPGIAATDVLLSVTTLAFDISVLELLLPLTVGAQVVLVDRTVASDGVALGQALTASGATIMQATPATWRLLRDAGWDGRAGLRVLCGGEALAPELAAYLLPRVRDVWNLYGPTETTIWSTRQRVQDASGPTLPIGRPVGNTQASVLDANGQRVPIGVVGELYLGGAGVARGYRGRPDLTAERFVPDGWSGQAGARLYRTGDLARYRADGTLEYVGRIDHQIKLRGFRIELGEIEAVLHAHPAVQTAVVVVREEQPGEPRLIAYVVSQMNPPHDPSLAVSPCDASELRTWLQTRLPAYMIPAVFVFLDALPLTPNGKIDRRALPTPDTLSLDNTAPAVAPATPTEAQLAALWSELLRQPVIGRQDEFFMLGGHSLLATQLVARVRATLGVELPLRVVFEAPTLAGLAARIDALRDTDSTQMPPLVAVERDQALPLSFAQQRLWFLDQLTPHSAAYNVPLALRLHGALDVAALQSSLNALVARHEALRTTFQLH